MASQPDASAVADGRPGDRLAGPRAAVIVKLWSEVRPGDVVLLDDVFVTAETVRAWEEPWGEGKTETLVDIGHRLDNGHLVSNERHGDGLTVVRQPATAPEPAVSYWWGVAYGGDDPNECAGILTYDDEAEAEEQVQWTVGGFLARQKVARWPWERADGKEIPPEAEAGEEPAADAGTAEVKLAAIAEHRNAACAALRIAETQARYPAGDEATAERYRAAREALEDTAAEAVR